MCFTIDNFRVINGICWCTVSSVNFTGSGILTTLSAKFNFNNTKLEIEQLIDNLGKLNKKIDYVVSCNGNLTEQKN